MARSWPKRRGGKISLHGEEMLLGPTADEKRLGSNAVVEKHFSVPIRAFLLAVTRLTEVATVADRGDDVYITVTEAANWLDNIKSFVAISGNVDVQGVLFARNRCHHQNASATYFDETKTSHVWRPATQLPLPSDRQYRGDKIRPFYVDRLQGKPVLDVFVRLEPVVRAARAIKN